MDANPTGATPNSNTKQYSVQLNFQGEPLGQRAPPPLNLYNNASDYNLNHTPQDAVGTKLSITNSHFRPCVPNEDPQLSFCAPLEKWRPCLPPTAVASGKESRTADTLGSSWPSEQCCSFRDRGSIDETCTSDRRRKLQLASLRSTNNRRAGILSDYGSSLMFPGARIITQKDIYRPHGKNFGDILPSLRPRSGDVFILPCVNSCFESRSDPRGYVGFIHNARDHDLNFDAGTMLLRIIKFRDSTLRIRKQLKLFVLTVNCRWRLKGELDTCRYLQDPCTPSNYKVVPVRHRRALKPNTSDLLCIPQRGDVIIREPWKDLFPHRQDKKNCLVWWQPNLELEVNDILVRTCVWKCCKSFEGFVDLYFYNGKGIKWIFLGRDETIFEPTTLGLDSDTSDDEKVSCDSGASVSTSYANPSAGNWPLHVPSDGSNLSDSESLFSIC